MGPDGTQAGAQVKAATPLPGAGHTGSGAGTGEGNGRAGTGSPAGATMAEALTATGAAGIEPEHARMSRSDTGFMRGGSPVGDEAPQRIIGHPRDGTELLPWQDQEPVNSRVAMSPSLVAAPRGRWQDDPATP